MAELNLKQITDHLNQMFAGDTRKLVFWYDDDAQFAEDVDALALENAKIYHLQPDNQFYTKYFLECVDRTTSYLIYAPFPKPDVKENHLEDMVLYSRRFYAERTSLLCDDLGIHKKYLPVLQRHSKFFANKDRVQRFYNLQIDNYNRETLCVGMLAALCKARVASFEEVVRILLTDGELENNKYLEEFDTYYLTQAFWKLCEQQFGYNDPTPTLGRLLLTLLVTCTVKTIPAQKLPRWASFVSCKSGNSQAFVDNLMNNVIYRDRFDQLSAQAAATLHAKEVFAALPPADLLDCELFLDADRILIHWLTERLIAEDTGAQLDGLSIGEVCEKRRKMHFGRDTDRVYKMLHEAWVLIQASCYACSTDFSTLVHNYLDTDYRLDQAYRAFYSAYDQLEDASLYETLRDRVEAIYTNVYLAKLIPQWNAALHKPGSLTALPLQRDFYAKRLSRSKERTVVILSDAMRYEVGQELFRTLQDDPKCTVTLDAQLGVLPSYTQLGMAALLPHTQLSMTEDFAVLVDGLPCDNLAKRQTILQKTCPESSCIQFDDVKNLKKAQLREIFTGKQVVYLYHNQIDARGDKPNTEDEVFVACREAVEEIAELIRRISVNANTYHFVVTADHGFLYKRDKLTASDKITPAPGSDAMINRRFVVSQQPVQAVGVSSLPLGMILDNADTRSVSFPIGSDVFKVAGGGQNFVHGGSSPQEMLVPVLDVKMERGHMETHPVPIALVSMVQKITNLITPLDFIQSEAVSDVVRAATYAIYFVGPDGEKISSEQIYVADSRAPEAQNRMFRLSFTLRNQKYDRSQICALVACDTATGLEVLRHEVIIDLAFTDDYGFDF